MRQQRIWKRTWKLLTAGLFAVLLLLGSAQVPAGAEEAEGRVMYVTATAYSALDPGNVIAVDPAVIPLGTHVFIPDYGEAVAEDIGWGIHGAMIDVAFDTHEEALMFGRQELEIYIMD